MQITLNIPNNLAQKVLDACKRSVITKVDSQLSVDQQIKAYILAELKQKVDFSEKQKQYEQTSVNTDTIT